MLRFAAAASLFLSSVAAASAGEACVACAEPDLTYRCSLERSGELKDLADKDTVVGQVCTKVLARLGGHARCTVVTSEAPCPGQARVLGVSDYVAVIGGADGTTPNTKVEGLIPGTARVATEGLQKTGEAISGTAKSTWDCVTSLFANCGARAPD